MDAPSKKPSNKMFGIMVFLVIFLPIICIMGLVMPPYTWGKEGSLSLSMTLDRTNFNVSERMSVTLVIKNTGTAKMRVDDSTDNFAVAVSKANGDLVESRFIRPMYGMTKVGYSSSSYNSALKEMAPGETVQYTVQIYNWTTQQREGYDIRPGETYSISGAFVSSNTQGFPVYPHWSGSLKTEAQAFTIRP